MINDARRGKNERATGAYGLYVRIASEFLTKHSAFSVSPKQPLET